MDNSISRIPEKRRALYEIVNDLEADFPGRKFTLDVHLVGSIGEVLVAERYGLTLLPPSAKTHDAVSSDGKFIQIKATQVNKMALRAEPDHLIVIKIHNDGSFTEVFKGSGELAWERAGKMQKNGQRSVSLTRIKGIMEEIEGERRIDS